MGGARRRRPCQSTTNKSGNNHTHHNLTPPSRDASPSAPAAFPSARSQPPRGAHRRLPAQRLRLCTAQRPQPSLISHISSFRFDCHYILPEQPTTPPLTLNSTNNSGGIRRCRLGACQPKTRPSVSHRADQFKLMQNTRGADCKHVRGERPCLRNGAPYRRQELENKPRMEHLF